MAYKSLETARNYKRKYHREILEGKRKPETLASLKRTAPTICSYCGESFHRSPSNQRTSNQYCSLKCMSNAFKGRFVGEKSPRWKGQQTKPCASCGKPVCRPLWAFHHDHTFCNSTCFGEWKSKNWTGEDSPSWRGGHLPYYGKNWIRQSREARHRDNHRCQLCDAPESELRRALDVHHICPIRLFSYEQLEKANHLSNLICLCQVCHKHAEHISETGTVKDWKSLLALLEV